MPQHQKTSARRLFGDAGASLLCGAAVLLALNGGVSAQSSDAADTTKLVIGESNSGIGQVPLYVAFQEGFFKKAGLDVEGQMLNGGTPAAMAAFANDSVNVLNLSVPELIPYVAHKVVSGKAFAEMLDGSYDIVATNGITSIPDIKGKTVGLSGPNAADYVFLVATMQHYGLTLKDVTFITSGNPINRLAALAKGVIQVTAETNALRAASMKSGIILLKSGDNPVQFPQIVFIANSDLLDNHKPLLKKFAAAMGAATVWMQVNQAAAAADCAKTTGATVEDCTTAVAINFDRSVSSKYTFSSTYAINVEGVKSALAVMATLDPTTKGLTVADIADTSVAGTIP